MNIYSFLIKKYLQWWLHVLLTLLEELEILHQSPVGSNNAQEQVTALQAQLAQMSKDMESLTEQNARLLR